MTRVAPTLGRSRESDKGGLGVGGFLWLALALTWPASARTAEVPRSALPPLPAAELSASFGVSTPEAEGIDSAKLLALTNWIRDQKLPLFSFLISRHGKLVYELYTSNLGRDEAHYVMSVTKSVTSALVGIVLDQGKLPGPDAPLTKVLPASLFSNPADAKRFSALTLKEVLGMSALDALEPPFATTPEAVERAKQLAAAKNHVVFALTQKLLPQPGVSFQYNDVTPQLAVGAVEYTTNQSAFQFAQKVLFEPLGFHNEEWMHEDAAGIDNGGYGLRLRPIDMQKFGLLYLRGGAWNGKQIISKKWVELSFQPWIRSGPEVNKANYGWYWWDETYVSGWESHEAHGWKGQRIVVIPSQELVITMTCDIENDTEQDVLRAIMRNFIVPAIRGAKTATPNPKVTADLLTAMSQLHSTNLLPPKVEARMVPSVAAKQQHHDFRP